MVAELSQVLAGLAKRPDVKGLIFRSGKPGMFIAGADLRELGPSYLFAPPRIFENILTQVMIRMEDAAWVKRRLFDYFLGLAKQVGPALLDARPVGWRDRLLYRLGDLLPANVVYVTEGEKAADKKRAWVAARALADAKVAPPPPPKSK